MKQKKVPTNDLLKKYKCRQQTKQSQQYIYKSKISIWCLLVKGEFRIKISPFHKLYWQNKTKKQSTPEARVMPHWSKAQAAFSEEPSSVPIMMSEGSKNCQLLQFQDIQCHRHPYTIYNIYTHTHIKSKYSQNQCIKHFDKAEYTSLLKTYYLKEIFWRSQ